MEQKKIQNNQWREGKTKKSNLKKLCVNMVKKSKQDAINRFKIQKKQQKKKIINTINTKKE